MAYSSLALASVAATADRTIWELKSPGSSSPAIIELALNLVLAVGFQVGLGKPSVNCTGPTPNPFQMDDSADLQTNVTACVSYSATGGVPSLYVRRGILGSSQSYSIVWTWPAGLRVPAGTAMALWAITTPAALNIHCIIED